MVFAASIRDLLRDSLVRLALAMVLFYAFCWTITVGGRSVSPGFLEMIIEQTLAWTGAVLVALAVVSLHRGITTLPAVAERSFWLDLRNASVPWLAVMVFYAFFTGRESPAWLKGGDQILYVLYYVGLYLAIERQPHRSHRWRSLAVERRLSWPTVLFAVVGLFLYFIFVPHWHGDQAGGRVTALFLLLDGYFSVRLFLLLRATEDARWRTIYLFLTLSTATIFFNDLMRAATYLGAVLPLWEMFSQWSWKLPALFLILAARVRHLRFPRRDPQTKVYLEENLPGPLGQTLFFALFFPLIHHSGYAGLFLDDENKGAREAVMIALVILLTILALLQYRMLARTTKILREEREEAEKALRRVEQKVQLRSHRRQLGQKVNTARRMFAKAFEICPDGVALTRLEDGRFIEVSAAWERMLGYSKAEALRSTSLELDVWCEDENRAKVVEILQREGRVVDISGKFRHSSGAIKEGLFSATVLEIGEEKCLLSISREIRQDG